MKLHDPTTPPSGIARAVGSPLAGCSIEAVLHTGPVFTLYRAVQAAGRERVVLKEYCPQALCERGADGAPLLRDPDDAQAFAAFEAGRAAFVDELHTLQQLRLPGLVQVRGILETEGSLCALLPLLPGVTLDELPLPQTDPALHALLLSLLEPLAQLHAAGLVHGALHARQLLWASGRMPVLLGFSLAARALGLAPEASGQAPELDPRSAHLPRGPWTDVYALAALVLQRLTGQPWLQADPAHAAEGVAARLEQALGTAREPAQRRVLVKALAAALAPAPDERPAHAGVLRELLGGSTPQWPPGAEPATVQAAPRFDGPAAAAAAVPRAEPRRPRTQPEAPWPGIHHPDAARPYTAPEGTEHPRMPPRHARGAGAAVHAAASWDRTVPTFRQGDSFVMPETPRQRNDSLRTLALTLLVGLGCGAMGWWVHGLWAAETERNRINRLIAQAATQVQSTPAWSADEAPSLPPLAAPVEPAALAADSAPPPSHAELSPLPASAQHAALATAPQGDGVPLPAVVAELAPRVDAVGAASPALAPQAVPAPLREGAAPQADALALAPPPPPAVPGALLNAPPPPAPRQTAVPRTERAATLVQVRPEPKAAPRPVAARTELPPARAGAPRNACGALAKYALLQCMQRQCAQSSWRKHPQCLRLLNDNVLSS
jgi:serine/threonine protein kinase